MDIRVRRHRIAGISVGLSESQRVRMFTEKVGAEVLARVLPVRVRPPPNGENGTDRLVKIDENRLQKWKDMEGLYDIY